jgi:integrase
MYTKKSNNFDKYLQEEDMAKKKKGLRADGRYVTHKTIGGEKKPFYSRLSLADAKKQAAKALEEYNKKLTTPNLSDKTLAEWLDEWLHTVKAGNVSPGQWSRLEQNCRIHIIPELGNYKLIDIEPPHILAFMAGRKKAVKCRKKDPTPEDLKKAPLITERTLAYIYTTLNAALEKARELRMIPFNPCEPVDKPIVPTKLPQPLKKDEEKKYLEQVAQHPLLYPISIVALDSGCRSGELLGLTWDRVYFSSGSIQIVKGKTKSAPRKIPLPTRSMTILSNHKKQQEQHQKEFGTYYKDNKLVFPMPDGSPTPNYKISKLFKKAALKAGIRPDARFHNLRDTHATELFELGEHPFAVKARIGHATIQQTNNYTKVSTQNSEDMIKKLDQQRSGQKTQVGQKVVKGQRILTIKKPSERSEG